MAVRRTGSTGPRAQQDEGQQPIVVADPVETALDGADDTLKYGEPVLVPADSGYAERPYAEAVTAEHREVLVAAGQMDE